MLGSSRRARVKEQSRGMAGGDSPEGKLVWQALLEGSDAQGSLGKVLIWDERAERAVRVKVNMQEGVWLAPSNSDWHCVSCPLAAEWGITACWSTGFSSEELCPVLTHPSPT